ncbi:hypothetical protein EVAR_67887_1 [Eumeta japonica]|uniref:Uncharacterized protein n=1 Tax=Eumeta variegata TaxID=151549 RepID=A0A4C1YWA7_EUMVA|nr:hypothetical protein EVAR_67887_1 [Eumeta japonica]
MGTIYSPDKRAPRRSRRSNIDTGGGLSTSTPRPRRLRPALADRSTWAYLELELYENEMVDERLSCLVHDKCFLPLVYLRIYLFVRADERCGGVLVISVFIWLQIRRRRCPAGGRSAAPDPGTGAIRQSHG